MVNFSRRISIQAEGTNNVLVIELQEDEHLVPYCCKVMEQNDIPGLLHMRHQFMDGVVRLRYNIGGKVPLREFMVRNRLTYENGILLLRNLSSALLHLNEYFLSVDMCYLDPEQIYVGDGLHVYLPCIPLQQEQVQNNSIRLKAFYEKLLSEYFATSDCSSYDNMFKWVYKATLFDLETFYNHFLSETSNDQKKLSPPVMVKPAAAPKEIINSLAGTVQQKENCQNVAPASHSISGEVAIPPARKESENSADINKSFAIPGGMAVPVSDARKKGKAEKEKKGFWPFSPRVGKADTIPDAPSPSPSKPDTLNPFPVEKPLSAPEENESWDSASILVDHLPEKNTHPTENEERQAGGGEGAYFIHKGKKVFITETPFLVGKYNTTCALHYAIYDNNHVSRSHATFLYDHGKYFIRDNQSRNGTFLNGQSLIPLQPAALKDGDEIRLYDEILTFHLV